LGLENKRLKVAQITPWGCKCGIFSYTRDLSLALAQEDVDVFIIRLPRFGEKTIEILQNVVDKIPKDVDLVCCQHEYGLYQLMEKPFYAMLKQLGKPIVTTVHAPGFKNDGVISAGSDRVIVHNQFCSGRFKYPSVIIPHGTSVVKCPEKDVCKKAYGIDPRIPVVGYLGFIGEMKGLETLISAMTKVSNAALLMCGGWHLGEGTAYMWSLKDKTNALLQGRCHWAGFVPDEQLSTAYGAFDILCYPSNYGTESGSLLLGLSHGKATIASNIPPFREKEQKGALVTFKDVDDLADKIKFLLENEAERCKLEEAAMKFAESTSWDKVAKMHISLYEEVLAAVEKPVDNPVNPA
jgi:glycosyltransferase involved in cell wall biosynthesis